MKSTGLNYYTAEVEIAGTCVFFKYETLCSVENETKTESKEHSQKPHRLVVILHLQINANVSGSKLRAAKRSENADETDFKMLH